MGIRSIGEIIVRIRYQKEIKELEKILSKQERVISEYEKRTTNKSAAIYKMGLEKRLNELRKTTKKMAALERERDRAIVGSAKKSSSEWFAAWHKRIKQSIRDWRVHREAARNAAINQRTLWGRVLQSMDKWTAKLRRSAAILTRYFAIYTVLFAIKNAIGEMISDFLHVNDNLATFNALTLSSYNTMRKMRQEVWRVAGMYGIAATEVSKFVVEMGKMGKTADEIHDIADVSASLSTILNEDMVESGKLVVTTLNQFNMTTAEASRVSGVFLRVIKNSPADINGLVNALQYAGTTAMNTGVSIEELGAMIQELANHGLKMSKIGTGLRNVLAKLAAKGYSVNDMLKEMHERGLSVAEAEEEFGRRGMNVALILSENYDQMMKIAKEALPTYVDAQVRAAIKTASTLRWFNKLWISIKGAFAGYSRTDAIRSMAGSDLVEEWSKIGLDEQRLIDIMNESVKKGKTVVEARKELYKVFENEAKLYYGKGSKGYNKVLDTFLYAGDWIDEVYKKQKQKYTSMKAIEKTETAYNNAVRSVLKLSQKSRIEITSEAKLLQKSGFTKDELVKMLTDNGMDYNAALKQADKIIQNGFKYFLANFKRNVQYYREMLRKVEKEKADLVEKANTKAGLTSDELTRLKDTNKQIDDIKNTICIMTTGTPCKNVRKSIHDQFTDVLNTIMDAYRHGMDSLRKKLAREIAEAGKLSQLSANGRKSPMTFSIYLKNVGFDQSKEFVGKKSELADAWMKQVNNTIDTLEEEARNRVEDAEKSLAEDFFSKRALGSSTLTSLKEQLKKAKTDKERAAVQKQIGNVQHDMDVLYDEYLKEAAQLHNALKDYITRTEQKRAEAQATDREVHTQDNKLREKTLLEDKRRVLGEIEKIYSEFNDVILNNYMRRLAAEKAAMEAHYREQRDILKAQLDEHLITEGQYEIRRRALEKRRIEEQNKINKAQFEARKKSQIAEILAREAVAFAEIAMTEFSSKGLFGIPTAALLEGIVAADTAAAIGAVLSQKFYPVKYATGGWIYGNSHAAGGVPINNGQIEAEGGEFIVNKVSAQKNAALIEDINKDPDFTDKLIAALSSSRIRAYFTDEDWDAAERNRTFKKNSLNYMK